MHQRKRRGISKVRGCYDSMEEKVKLNYKGSNLEISYNFREEAEEPILFIHGLGCSKESFKDVWNFAEFENYTILTFDLLGFGDSSKPKAFSYTMEEHAEICKLIIEKFGLEQIHLVGHSMGGAIGLLLIEKIPSKIVSFINLEGNLIGEDCTYSREAVRYSLEDFEGGVFEDFKSGIEDGKDLAASTSPSTRRVFYNWLSKSDAYAFYRSSESLVEWSDSRELLKMFVELDIKRCYVFGEMNKNLPVIKMLGDVPKVEISNSGHFMMSDNPEETYQKLLEGL